MPPVEIQWCDHSTVLLEYLRQLYDEGRFVDVGLECEGRQVKAHKAVISACSPYLEVITLYCLPCLRCLIVFVVILMSFDFRGDFKISPVTFPR